MSILWTEDGAGSITAGTESTLTPIYTPLAGDAGNIVTFTLTGNGNGSCAAVMSTMLLTVTDEPVVDAGSDDEVCVNTVFDFSTMQTTGATESQTSSLLWIEDGFGSITAGTETTLTPIYTPLPGDAGKVVTLIMTGNGNGS